MTNQTFEFWNKRKVELSPDGVLPWRQLLKFEVPLVSVSSCVVKARTFSEIYQLELVVDGGGSSGIGGANASGGGNSGSK